MRSGFSGNFCKHKRFLHSLVRLQVSHPADVWINVDGGQSCSWSTESAKMSFPLSPFAPENSVSQNGFGLPAPRQPTHSPQPGSIWCLRTRSSPSSCFPRRGPSIPSTPSGQTRVFQAMQLLTSGVHCRESAGAGPIVFE